MSFNTPSILETFQILVKPSASMKGLYISLVQGPFALPPLGSHLLDSLHCSDGMSLLFLFNFILYLILVL
jgi:hypothetical protein